MWNLRSEIVADEYPIVQAIGRYSGRDVQLSCSLGRALFCHHDTSCLVCLASPQKTSVGVGWRLVFRMGRSQTGARDEANHRLSGGRKCQSQAIAIRMARLSSCSQALLCWRYVEQQWQHTSLVCWSCGWLHSAPCRPCGLPTKVPVTPLPSCPDPTQCEAVRGDAGAGVQL
jgi:hypothetical protein